MQRYCVGLASMPQEIVGFITEAQVECKSPQRQKGKIWLLMRKDHLI